MSQLNWPHNGCVALWRFENNANDSSGNGFTLNGNGGVGYAGGHYGYAASFDGLNDSFVVAKSALFQAANFTWSAWVAPTSGVYADHTMTFFADFLQSDSHPSGIYGIGWGIYDYCLKMNIGSGAHLDSVLGETDIMDGTWHHVIATRDADYARLYLDGGVDGELADPPEPSYTAYPGYEIIGAMYRDIGSISTIDYYCGLLDELCIRNYAMSEAQARRLYAFETGRL